MEKMQKCSSVNLSGRMCIGAEDGGCSWTDNQDSCVLRRCQWSDKANDWWLWKAKLQKWISEHVSGSIWTFINGCG